MALDFRPPTEQDILDMIEGISLEDERELLAQGVEVEWAIRNSIKTASECVAALADGKLLCITGVSSENLTGDIYPWLLGTDEMQKHPRAVLKYSRMLLQRWQARHPYMTNWVDARHHRAISWLTHLGATLEFIPQHGLYRRPFYKFSFGSDPNVL